jgi:hypothetical protein
MSFGVGCPMNDRLARELAMLLETAVQTAAFGDDDAAAMRWMRQRYAETMAEHRARLALIPVHRWNVPVQGGGFVPFEADREDAARLRAVEEDAEGVYYAVHTDGSYGERVTARPTEYLAEVQP